MTDQTNAAASLAAKLAALGETLSDEERALFTAILHAAHSAAVEVAGYDDTGNPFQGRELGVGVTTVLSQPALAVPFGINWQQREPTKLPNPGNFSRF